MKPITTQVSGNRQVITAEDPNDVRYVRIGLFDENGKFVRLLDGPWPQGVAQQKHDKMVRQIDSSNVTDPEELYYDPERWDGLS